MGINPVFVCHTIETQINTKTIFLVQMYNIITKQQNKFKKIIRMALARDCRKLSETNLTIRLPVS